MVRHVGVCIVHADVTLTQPSIQGQGQSHGASEVPKIAENCTLLGLSPLPLWRAV